MAYRLSKEVRPKRYDLAIDIDLEAFRFQGKEKVDISISKLTDKVVMNSADLDIENVSCIHKGKDIKTRFKAKGEEVIIILGKKVKGDIALHLGFKGHIRKDLAGLYRSRYVEDGKERFLATTQFEPADARRVFPCFDEPSFKAVFSVSLTFDKQMEAISNMPAKKEKMKADMKTVTFQETPVMSTYLLYIGVGDFKFLEDKAGRTRLRVAATPGKERHGKFALNIAKQVLNYYNDYFGIPYPLPKLDQVALPDFAAGAMENWGAITYREIAMLIDENSSNAAKHQVAMIIAHEIAHMWFGDLVTMEWWNDLWLNESFATWMSYKAINDLYPEWDMWSQFIQDETIGALALDALQSSHPIKADVKEPHEVGQIFDAISYNKGGSILRMLEAHIGPEKFRDGLRDYMKEHAYGNAVTDDLWDSLSENSGLDVKALMHSWINQTGYPLVSVSLKKDDLEVRQERFLLSRKRGQGIWKVPLTVQYAENKALSFLMKKSSERRYIGNHDFLKVNPGHCGFFRTKYDRGQLAVLRDLVSSKELQEFDRWGIQNDLYALARAAQIKLDDYLSFLEAYEDEDSFIVLFDLAGNLTSSFIIGSEPMRKRIKTRALPLFQKYLASVGWEKKSGEPETRALVRSSVLKALAMMEDPETLKKGRKRFEKYMKSPKDTDPDIRSSLLSIGAAHGNKELYELFKDRYTKEVSAEEKRRFLVALASFKSEELVNKALSFALSDDVRFQDTYVPVVSAARNPKAKSLLWPWVKENWSELLKRFGGGGNIKMLEKFVEPIGVMSDNAIARDMKSYFSRQEGMEKIQRALSQTIERIGINHRFVRNN